MFELFGKRFYEKFQEGAMLSAAGGVKAILNISNDQEQDIVVKVSFYVSEYTGPTQLTVIWPNHQGKSTLNLDAQTQVITRVLTLHRGVNQVVFDTSMPDLKSNHAKHFRLDGVSFNVTNGEK